MLLTDNHDFLNNEISHRKTTAPITDVNKLPKKLSEVTIPTLSNSQPPSTPPMMPTMMLTNTPEPMPFINFPAIQPASPPIIINHKKLPIIFLLNDDNHYQINIQTKLLFSESPLNSCDFCNPRSRTRDRG